MYIGTIGKPVTSSSSHLSKLHKTFVLFLIGTLPLTPRTTVQSNYLITMSQPSGRTILFYLQILVYFNCKSSDGFYKLITIVMFNCYQLC